MIKKEVELWVRQALSDLDAAKYNLAGKKYDVAVFLAHQAAEKVLKALRIQELRELIKTHDLLRLAKDVDAPLLLIQKCSLLNPVYI
ncbi:HEPN domain-containing protein [Candidatus Woesearchaeota archaeon]|nr:HEPN domain-containing protein [Candidatus Woesearchaeota archaeon]